MVKVVRTEKEFERVMLLEQKVWDRLVKKPNLVAGVKWRLWTKPVKATTRFVEVPIDAEIEIITKKVEPKKVVPEKRDETLKLDPVEFEYTEKEYKADFALAKNLVAEDGGKGAKEAFERALAFKPKNPYIKSQLKKL